MAGLRSLGKTVSKIFSSFSLNSTTKHVPRTISSMQPCSYFHCSSPNHDLMEFFDDEKNWGKNEVRVGRSWKTDELRIKGNEDLHKLWYVLLKEKNMLLTMEQECKTEVRLFPNPERIDKVEESMKNLETVIRERNEAYFQLETGETGERGGYLRTGVVGLKYFHRRREYHIPKFMNKKWFKDFTSYEHTYDVKQFLGLYREQLYLEKKKARNRERNHVMGLIRRFPNLDLEAVKEKYPSVDIQKALYSKKARGHRENLV